MTAPLEADLKDPGKSAPPGEQGGSSDPVLRAKYLDYCSARVAELLLQLTPDEMYLLAQDATQESESEAAEPLSYTQIVQLATNRISRKLSLPDFPTWVEAYREDPQRYDREMLGLWESDLKTSDRSAE
ncbi:MAG: hypothetical protein EXR92_00480 [Gemmatimonadetes bacterium]|nr:hypothetical protein [Gemmatimonadota bacterium]